MKVGIMQPYFMPYLGYWQLMNAVDKYVIYDDVNFIKGGWVNRNRILVNGQPKYFNLPMIGASSFKKINEVGVNNDTKLIEKNLRIIEGAYRKAPFFDTVLPIIRDIVYCNKKNVAEYIIYSFKVINAYLEISTELLVSSALEKDCNLRAQDKVLAICELLGAKEYYNAIGGRELYSFSNFAEKGIQLKFLKANNIKYVQFGDEFQENLSIIDVMMFNSKEKIKEMLNEYEVIGERL